jgi:hypothetical protein
LKMMFGLSPFLWKGKGVGNGTKEIGSICGAGNLL